MVADVCHRRNLAERPPGEQPTLAFAAPSVGQEGPSLRGSHILRGSEEADGVCPGSLFCDLRVASRLTGQKDSFGFPRQSRQETLMAKSKTTA